MSELDAAAQKRTADRRGQQGGNEAPFPDRRKAPRPPLAEIRRGGTLRLMPPVVVSGVVRVVEFLLIVLLGLAIYLSYVEYEGDRTHLFYLVAIFVAALGYMMIADVFGLYKVPSFNTFVPSFTRVVIAWTIVMAGLMSIAFFSKISADFSRVWIATWYVSGLGVLFVERLLVSVMARQWLKEGRLYRRAVIVGGGPEAENLIKALEASADADIRIVGVFDDRGADRVAPIIAGYPKLGNINELVEYARTSRLDLLIVTLPITAEQRLLHLLKKLQVLPVDIRLSVHGSPLRFRPRTYSYIGNVPFIDLTDKPIANWDVVKKWLFDKIVAFFAVVALAPVMALIAIAVKLDSKGPVLFKQKRLGFNNETIGVLKFRSMYVEGESPDGLEQVTRDDPRVTRVGRILRRTSLDELPQFFNVLKGDLSLVGPRPHALQSKAADKLYHDAVDGYFARHRVKPGVTGWAQINGWRGETDTAEKIERRVEHDLYYIENWSVMFDLYILLMTPLALVRGENAY
ncbi:undecaprenyl-phosphate glucose phosphotransferase [Methyloceanibacter stevinii]|uniref:Undecaprenyl-phosphate glucose phosphotransferase n=1 Tax=Methyloceanibacter stevinii TaxID=1774970 RepID=A0A1E3VKW9_9HYPH|nr:undecaprenyl-phosphate glucose phosphotransferase [Methyloceanibacter stevinii]ODR94152.1 undecaprenyl-phosphate glucose phosphotransferase [Methyloceanibacter stevinii]